MTPAIGTGIASAAGKSHGKNHSNALCRVLANTAELIERDGELLEAEPVQLVVLAAERAQPVSTLPSPAGARNEGAPEAVLEEAPGLRLTVHGVDPSSPKAYTLTSTPEELREPARGRQHHNDVDQGRAA